MEIKINVNNNNGEVKAFEGDNQVGQLDFAFIPDGLSIEHTRTFEGNEGKGIAGALVTAATDYAAAHRLKVKAVCSYAQGWYKRHPQFDDILIDEKTKLAKGITKVFVMATCPDCTQVKAQLANHPDFEKNRKNADAHLSPLHFAGEHVGHWHAPSCQHHSDA